jgi:hypothetical protein
MKNNRPTKFNGARPSTVNLEDAKSFPVVECVNPECDGTFFAPASRFYKKSALLTQSGKPEYAVEPRSYCIKCGTVLPLTP